MNPATEPPRRVVFCGCEGLFSGLVLRRLLACPNLEVVAVVRSTRILRVRYGFLRGAWHQVRLSGLPYATYLWIATTCADALSSSGLRRLARRHRIPTLATRSINDPTGLAFVTAARPDILLCAFFNQRIGAAMRGLPRSAALNIHPSLLPEFKGVDPVFFALQREAPALGVTVHHLSDALDSGHILVQQALPINAGDSVLRTTARLFDHGGHLLTSLLAHRARVPSGRPQTGPDRYDSWPTPPQVRQLLRRGVPLWRTADLTWAQPQ